MNTVEKHTRYRKIVNKCRLQITNNVIEINELRRDNIRLEKRLARYLKRLNDHGDE